MLGHEKQGSGPVGVVVLNDWICDTSTWDAVRAFLDTSRFTWAFTDLRGYGRSRGQSGAFTVEEAAGDVIELADAIGWPNCVIVGHSMSSLVALHLAQHFPSRIERVVAITPPPPTGFGSDDTLFEAQRTLALGDVAMKMRGLPRMWGDRLPEGWTRFKAERWHATADPEAAAGYVAMFSRRGLPSPNMHIVAPVLAITGEQDFEPMRKAAVTAALSPICERLVVSSLTESGHYPMQEAPPLFVATIERFLREGMGNPGDTGLQV